ncbi:MAG: hypothetical protein BGO70_13585 [Bacteroidetes bacterium 43-93]|nr:hypothetical protein [Bacteroidota bacterium]OJW99467.1 MAG: hypothetical protein BGO70_13585 [Bacteroidetes bacterium 43-93]
MKLFYLVVTFSLLTIACNKNHTTPTPTGNNPSTGNNTTTGIDSTSRKFTGKYRLFDSTYHYFAALSPYTKDTTIITPLNRVVDVVMDSTAKDILVDKADFKYNDYYPSYAGYYSYFESPANNTCVVLSEDTIKIITVTNQFHISTSAVALGYRVL